MRYWSTSRASFRSDLLPNNTRMVFSFLLLWHRSIHSFRLSKDFSSLIIGARTGEVEHDEGDEGVLEVAGDQRPEPLLSGSVPKLHAEDAVADVQVFGHEVDANSRLRV